MLRMLLKRILFLCGFCIMIMPTGRALADAAQDNILKGYAQAYSLHVLGLTGPQITVAAGQVTIKATDGPVGWPNRALEALSQVPGFDSLVVIGPAKW